MISFIIPLNNRKLDRLAGLCYNISNFYLNDSYEIIIAEQDSKEPFKLGQMRNLGFKKSIGDIIVFLDVDIRFKEYIDFCSILKKIKNRPIVCWEFIIQVDEDKFFNIIEREGKRKGVGKGGCVAFTREKFIESCGNSNLIIGWGKEDNILDYRSKMERLMGQEIYHVFHNDKREKWGLGEDRSFLGLALSRNVRIANLVRDGKIDKYKDGFEQTFADCTEIEIKDLYKHYFFSNVSVFDGFEYKNLYNEFINGINN
jgi:hypothetical protein